MADFVKFVVLAKILNILKLLFGLLVSILTWEHVARTNGSALKPSVFFNFLATHLNTFFQRAGEYFAILSSYLTYIDLKDLKQTLVDVFKPLFDICVSPFYFIYGYMVMARSYVSDTYLIYFGSVLGFCVVIYVIGLIALRYPNNRFTKFFISLYTKMMQYCDDLFKSTNVVNPQPTRPIPIRPIQNYE